MTRDCWGIARSKARPDISGSKSTMRWRLRNKSTFSVRKALSRWQFIFVKRPTRRRPPLTKSAGYADAYIPKMTSKSSMLGECDNARKTLALRGFSWFNCEGLRPALLGSVTSTFLRLAMTKTVAELIARLKDKGQKLGLRLNSLEREAKDHKLDTRRKIIVGGVVIAEMEKDPDFANVVQTLLLRYVGRPHDRRAIARLLPSTSSHASTQPEPKSASLDDVGDELARLLDLPVSPPDQLSDGG